MLKKLAVASAAAATMGSMALATPAQAGDWDNGRALNLQILPIQICDLQGLTILGFRTHNGPCTNGAIQAVS